MFTDQDPDREDAQLFWRRDAILTIDMEKKVIYLWCLPHWFYYFSFIKSINYCDCKHNVYFYPWQPWFWGIWKWNMYKSDYQFMQSGASKLSCGRTALKQKQKTGFTDFHWNLNQSLTEVWEKLSGWRTREFSKSNGEQIRSSHPNHCVFTPCPMQCVWLTTLPYKWHLSLDLYETGRMTSTISMFLCSLLFMCLLVVQYWCWLWRWRIQWQWICCSWKHITITSSAYIHVQIQTLQFLLEYWCSLTMATMIHCDLLIPLSSMDSFTRVFSIELAVVLWLSILYWAGMRCRVSTVDC